MHTHSGRPGGGGERCCQDAVSRRRWHRAGRWRGGGCRACPDRRCAHIQQRAVSAPSLITTGAHVWLSCRHDRRCRMASSTTAARRVLVADDEDVVPTTAAVAVVAFAGSGATRRSVINVSCTATNVQPLAPTAISVARDSNAPLKYTYCCVHQSRRAYRLRCIPKRDCRSHE